MATQGCMCGWRGDPRVPCRCSDQAVLSYLGRLSGPLLDRIDLHIDVGRVEPDHLLAGAAPAVGEWTSGAVRSRVVAARRRAQGRLAGTPGVYANADLGPALVRTHCVVRGSGLRLLRLAAEKLALTARSLDRTLKVARTIADLAGAGEIGEEHLAEALQYRGLERVRPRAE